MFSSRDGSGVSLEIESDREEGLLKDVVLISRKLLFCSALPIGEISRNELWNNNQNGVDCFFLWGIYILFFVFRFCFVFVSLFRFGIFVLFLI